MGVILDADVVIRGEKRLFDLQQWLDDRSDDEFFIAAITIAELWHGVERAKGKQRSQRKSYLQGVLSVLPVLNYTKRTALFHARLWAKLQQAGTMIGYYDLLVAAAAMEFGLDIATFNIRHFKLVPGVKLIEPGV